MARHQGDGVPRRARQTSKRAPRAEVAGDAQGDKPATASQDGASASPPIVELQAVVGRGVTTNWARDQEIKIALRLLEKANLAPEWVEHDENPTEHSVRWYSDDTEDRLPRPITLASWAAWAVLAVAKEWLYWAKFAAVEERDRHRIWEHIEVLAAAATLLQWIENKTARLIAADSGVDRLGIAATSWHFWSGLLAQRILTQGGFCRTFLGVIFGPHRAIVYASCAGSTLERAGIKTSVAPLVARLLAGVNGTFLVEAERGLRTEYAGAWKMVVYSERSPATAPREPKNTRERVLLVIHRSPGKYQTHAEIAEEAETTPETVARQCAGDIKKRRDGYHLLDKAVEELRRQRLIVD